MAAKRRSTLAEQKIGKAKTEKVMTIGEHTVKVLGEADGRKVVHAAKYNKETVFEYHARLRSMGIGKRFKTGRITDVSVLRDIETGDYSCNQVVLSDAELSEITARFKREAAEAASLPEKGTAELAKTRHMVRQMEADMNAQAEAAGVATAEAEPSLSMGEELSMGEDITPEDI